MSFGRAVTLLLTLFNDLRTGFRYGARAGCGAKPLWDKVWPHLDPWESVRLRTASTHWNVPGKYGPHGELFCFLIQKEQVVAPNEVLPNPRASAETLKACALIGLHLLAADYEVG